jgi:hypothetical protein
VSRAKNPFVETFSHYATARMHPPCQLGRRTLAGMVKPGASN